MLINEEKYLKNFGKNLRKLRIEKDLSQFQLSIESGLTKNQIGRIERAQTNASITTIIKIANALNIELSELIILKNKPQ